MAALLGCIADDFTGATDLAGMLVKHGMRTVQMIGVPPAAPAAGTDAIVVALKTRTAPPEEAIASSLAALEWLRGAGCRQILFKYCSTFDSTDRGNIGPVAEALMDALETDFTIACPAFPANGRAVFRGYLFVGDVLLHESGMQHHPLTPMTDSNLVRVLQRQSRRKVGLIRHEDVRAGTEAIRRAFTNARSGGTAMAIVDATSDADLTAIGAACYDLPLLTGGSGIAMGLPANFRAQGLLAQSSARGRIAASGGLGGGSLGQLLARHSAPGGEDERAGAGVPGGSTAPGIRSRCGDGSGGLGLGAAGQRAGFGLRHGRRGHGEGRAE